MVNPEWLVKMRKGFHPMVCSNCGKALMVGLYPSTEYWTGCSCDEHIPQCLGREEDEDC